MLAASQEITPTGNLGDLDQDHFPIPETARFAYVCDGPEQFRLAARRFARNGVDIVKVNVSGDRDWGHMGADANTTLIDDDELEALVSVAHGRGLRVAAHATSAGSVKMCVRHGVDIIYHAALADSEALDMIESVKDNVFVAPAVGFPYAYLHEGEKYGLHLSAAGAARVGGRDRDDSAQHAGAAQARCPHRSRRRLRVGVHADGT